MHVIESITAKEFLEANRGLLTKNEAGNPILLGYAYQHIQGIESTMSTKFCAVTEDDKPLLPVMFTPEVGPLLTEGPDMVMRIS
ncbi:MAG: hypothetical protein QF590_06915 [Dehalococcoidia bacterium]|nr:hypothetical protein [Dehalococcoidia bacterium]